MYDIAIFSIPYFETTAPGAGPAVLKGYLTSQGFKVVTYDWNLTIKEKINDPIIYGELTSYWIRGTKQDLSASTLAFYNELLENFAKEFLAIETKWLGFGVFSLASRQCLHDLLIHINKHNIKQIKIVVGGHGLDDVYLDTISKYIDVWIKGEGELALKELLNGNLSYPGIMSHPTQITDLDQLGFADYSDYDLQSKHYMLWYDSPMIQITGSRGCVRDCSFCDVGSIWKKYRYRSGKSIANEIIANHEKTGIKHFYFTDSLINGNLKSLMSMMQILSIYKKQTGSDLTWGGQWITRKQKGLPKDYYKMIKSSGGFNLTIGVETGSDAVRAHMKKGFTNQDLDDEMHQFSMHGISCAFFIVLGYPTETEEDFKDTLRMFKKYVKYVADGTLIGVSIGRGYLPLENTPISNEGKAVKFLNNDKLKWISTTTNSSYIENVRRRLIAQKVLTSLKWPSNNIEYELRPVITNSKLLFNEADKTVIKNLLVNKDIEPDSEFLAENKPHVYKLSVELELGNSCSDTSPIIVISVNNEICETFKVIGNQILDFYIKKPRKRNLIKIHLLNAIDGIQVKVNNMTIHGSRFDKDFLYQHGSVKHNSTRYKGNCLFKQDEIFCLYFENPVHAHFISKHKFYYETRYQYAKDILDKVTHLYENFVN